MTAHVSDNPELYARMAAPYASKLEATAALAAFLADVQAARERHRIAEVAMVAAAHTSDSQDLTAQIVGLGSSEILPFIAARLYGHFAGEILGAARMLQRIASGEPAPYSPGAQLLDALETLRGT